MMTLRTVLVLVFLSTPARGGPAQAEAEPEERGIAAATIPFGTRTREWLVLQQQGGPERHARPLPPEAESHSFERYLKSFTHPIPERFDLDRLDVRRP
jgi:hypothetical protein